MTRQRGSLSLPRHSYQQDDATHKLCTALVMAVEEGQIGQKARLNVFASAVVAHKLACNRP